VLKTQGNDHLQAGERPEARVAYTSGLCIALRQQLPYLFSTLRLKPAGSGARRVADSNELKGAVKEYLESPGADLPGPQTFKVGHGYEDLSLTAPNLPAAIL
jgi:hypothetical protein